MLPPKNDILGSCFKNALFSPENSGRLLHFEDQSSVVLISFYFNGTNVGVAELVHVGDQSS